MDDVKLSAEWCEARARHFETMADLEKERERMRQDLNDAILALPEPPPSRGGGWRPGPFAEVHELKTWPEFYEAVEDERKPWELREFDRPYKVGDILHLREWRPHTERYSGRECWRGVTYLFVGDGGWLPKGKCIMGLVPYAPPSTDPVPVGGDEHPTPDAAGELADEAALRKGFEGGWWFNTGGDALADGRPDEELKAWEERDWQEWRSFQLSAQAASRLRSQGSE